MGGIRLYRSLQKRAGTLNIRRLALIKKNQVSQVEEFSTFLCMGRCRSLGSLNSLLSCSSQLPGAGILRFEFHILCHRSHTCGGGLPMARWEALSFLGTLQAQKFTFEGPEPLMAVTPLFTGTAGDAPFLSPFLVRICSTRLQRLNLVLGGERAQVPLDPARWKVHMPSALSPHQDHQGPVEGSPSPGGQQGGGPSIPRAAGKLRPSLRPHHSSAPPSAQPCPHPRPLCRQIPAAPSGPASWGTRVAATTR